MASKCVAINKTDVIFMGRQVWWKLTCIWLSFEMVEGFSRDKLLVRVGGVIHFDFKHHTGKREKEYIMWKTITPAACIIIGMGLAFCSCRQKNPVWLSSWCTNITSFMCHVITGNFFSIFTKCVALLCLLYKTRCSFTCCDDAQLVLFWFPKHIMGRQHWVCFDSQSSCWAHVQTGCKMMACVG